LEECQLEVFLRVLNNMVVNCSICWPLCLVWCQHNFCRFQYQDVEFLLTVWSTPGQPCLQEILFIYPKNPQFSKLSVNPNVACGSLVIAQS
jgi:hypothetical protein